MPAVPTSDEVNTAPKFQCRRQIGKQFVEIRPVILDIKFVDRFTETTSNIMGQFYVIYAKK
jgi:hypothetical protein